jgi:hypothetical protein
VAIIEPDVKVPRGNLHPTELARMHADRPTLDPEGPEVLSFVAGQTRHQRT